MIVLLYASMEEFGRSDRAGYLLSASGSGLSENIRVMIVIDDFWSTPGFTISTIINPEYYIGSADWMRRNLDFRVEAVTPILDPDNQAELMDILQIMLNDNRNAWDMMSDGSYVQRRPPSGTKSTSTHEVLMKRALERSTRVHAVK